MRKIRSRLGISVLMAHFFWSKRMVNVNHFTVTSSSKQYPLPPRVQARRSCHDYGDETMWWGYSLKAKRLVKR